MGFSSNRVKNRMDPRFGTALAGVPADIRCIIEPRHDGYRASPAVVGTGIDCQYGLGPADDIRAHLRSFNEFSFPRGYIRRRQGKHANR